ncbi:DUF1937 family protein [uncultured Methylophaga sp.]|uniref:DUF1937 family protein n=1 Tax=uncultured Methylophaga sp. TaxID=285271 RepID=UPI0030F7A2CE
MIYIASPYSHKDPAVMQHRYEKVKEYTAYLMRIGAAAYSPIVHGHDIARSHELPTDWEFWKAHCLAMLRKADQMQVLKLPGWQESKGVQAEIEFCRLCGINIYYREMPGVSNG